MSLCPPDTFLLPKVRTATPHPLSPTVPDRVRTSADIWRSLRWAQTEQDLRRWKQPPRRIAPLPHEPATDALHAAPPWQEQIPDAAPPVAAPHRRSASALL